jgi:F-type H+-transporting ATPase subunit delta
MLDTTLAIRYARALHRMTSAAGTTRIVAAQLTEFCGLLESVKILKKVLYHPGITAAEKVAVVKELLAGSAEATTIRFITYIIGKKRIFHLQAMAKNFAALLADDENRITVRLETFKPLSDDLQKSLIERLTAMLKKEITVVTEVTPSLLGGIRLTLGDKVIDGSISHQLKNLTQIVTAV